MASATTPDSTASDAASDARASGAPGRAGPADQSAAPVGRHSPRLSVIIPTLNAAATLAATLEAVGVPEIDHEIIIVDGGSEDGTPRVAEAFGVRLLTGPRGRGCQMAAGGEAARGEWLLFVHADSVPRPGWQLAAHAFMVAPENTYKAGHFIFQLDDDNPQARRVEALTNWRSRTLGLPYGDQGLLISRAYYDHLGGYEQIALMEDVAMARRIGARRLRQLDAVMVTSAARYRSDGYWGRPLRNIICLGLYFLGLPPRAIDRFYRWKGF